MVWISERLRGIFKWDINFAFLLSFEAFCNILGFVKLLRFSVR